MSAKKIISLIVFSIGAVLVICAIHYMQTALEAKQNITTLAGTSSQEPLMVIIRDALKTEVSQNDVPLIYLLAGGMALLIGGGSALLCFKDRL